ncbi:hypothetical protein M426DRAFT_6717 [Hypoxylon sp. CI-4A]|nr:hypothetical protein M426DRAFT_6717 [Hypoxylon sp. CI-4A]
MLAKLVLAFIFASGLASAQTSNPGGPVQSLSEGISSITATDQGTSGVMSIQTDTSILSIQTDTVPGSDDSTVSPTPSSTSPVSSSATETSSSSSETASTSSSASDAEGAAPRETGYVLAAAAGLNHFMSLSAWSQIAAAFLLNFCTLGLNNSYGVFQSYYESNTLSYTSPSAISWIGTTQGFLLSVIGLVSGPLFDRGYIWPLLLVGTILNVLGLICTSFTEQYPWVFISFGVLSGLGSGALYVPANALVETYFSTPTPMATGLAMSGSSIGGMVYPILFRLLQDRIGFGWTCRVLAIINLVLLIVCCLLIKWRGKMAQQPEHGLFDKRIVRDWKLVLFGGCALLMNMGIDTPFFFIPSFAQENLKLSATAGDSLLSGLNGSSLVGRLFLSWLATSRFDPICLWQFSIFAASGMLFSWFAIENLAGMIVFIILYGIFVGGLVSLIPASVRKIRPEAHLFGARLGLVEGFQGVGYLVGPPISGAIRDTSAGYLGVSLFTGSLYFVLSLVVGAFTWRRASRLGCEESPDEDIELRPIKAAGWTPSRVSSEEIHNNDLRPRYDRASTWSGPKVPFDDASEFRRARANSW